MTHGLRTAGLRVLGGIDNDLTCKDTYEANNSGSLFLHGDITEMPCDSVAADLGLSANDDDLVMVGCSPCQYWSKIYTDRTRSATTAYLLREFQRFVESLSPGFVVIENVPGLQRRRDQSALPDFLSMLDQKGYKYAEGVINANHYGVPQNRKRYLLIASRLVDHVDLPLGIDGNELLVRNFLGEDNGFHQIPAGHVDGSPWMHTAAGLSSENLRRIRLTPTDGGDRSAWAEDPELQIPTYAGRDEIFRDVYGRMAWDRPAPTITTRFISLSNGRFGHPEEDRAISLREGATLQTFPKDYCFLGTSQATVARHIGNAVPPALAERIGKHLLSIRKQHGSV